MSFEIKDKDLAGRIGKLVTKSGVIETPAFFPVVNPFRKRESVNVDVIKEVGFKQLITNAYIIKQRLGAKSIDVHKLLGFNDVVMTDSGAYQLLMYGGERVRIDPVEIVEYQESLGSDIAVIADIPTKSDATYSEALESVRETLRRAERVRSIISGSRTIWVLPIQGGVYTDLVDYAATQALRMPEYGMYAIGSPVTVLEKYEFYRIVDMVIAAKKRLPPDKPVHLFGGGHPLIMPLMVAIGVDSFDSASYILYARDGRYITEHGTYRIDELDYLPCECPVCSNYTAEELRNLGREERTQLIAKHNLYVIAREIRRIKQAIRYGRLWELIEERARTHPSVREAFNHLIKHISWIEKFDPAVKGRIKGIFLYDETSYFRPELIRHRRKTELLINNKLSRSEDYDRLIILPADLQNKPFRTSPLYQRVKEELRLGGRDLIIFYAPFFNTVLLDSDQTYPCSQFEAPLTYYSNSMIMQNLCSSLKSLTLKALMRGLRVVIIISEGVKESCSDLLNLCRREGVNCLPELTYRV